MDTTHKFIARIAGAILLLFGVGLVAFALWATARIFSSEARSGYFARMVVVVFLGLGLLLSSMGLRLVANRPNKYQSMLPPVGWDVLSFVFFALGAMLG